MVNLEICCIIIYNETELKKAIYDIRKLMKTAVTYMECERFI